MLDKATYKRLATEWMDAQRAVSDKLVDDSVIDHAWVRELEVLDAAEQQAHDAFFEYVWSQGTTRPG